MFTWFKRFWGSRFLRIDHDTVSQVRELAVKLQATNMDVLKRAIMVIQVANDVHSGQNSSVTITLIDNKTGKMKDLTF